MSDKKYYGASHTFTDRKEGGTIELKGGSGETLVIIGSLSSTNRNYGCLYQTVAGITDLTQNNWVKIAGTTDAYLSNFTHSNNRLTYTGSAPMVFKVGFSIYAEGTGGIEISFGVSKNGDAPATHLISENIVSTTVGEINIKNASLFSVIALTTGDYIELHARNKSSSADILAFRFNMTVSD